MRQVLMHLLRDERGATAIEYGLIAALIAVAMIVALTAFGTSVQGMFGRVRDDAGSAMDGAGI